MDWNAAIGRQREALLGILAALVVMAGDGAAGGAAGGAPTLPRHLHRALLRLLRPAEAAARRLVIALAHTLSAPILHEARPLPPHASEPRRPSILAGGVGTGILMPKAPPRAARARPQKISLPLFDRLRKPVFGPRPVRRGASGVPRISTPGQGTLFPVAVRRLPSPRDPIDATRLRLRLRALAAALDDVPAQARRFARWQARLAAAGAGNGKHRDGKRFGRVSPLKPGRPPGWRRKPVHAVHEVLKDAHWLALTALERRDTS